MEAGGAGAVTVQALDPVDGVAGMGGMVSGVQDALTSPLKPILQFGPGVEL